MMGLYFDELLLGQTLELGSYEFTDGNISSFKTQFAPVPFHMDAGEAAAGLFGKPVAVGFHICSAWMPCFVAANRRERDRLAAKGKRLPEPGPGLGLHEIRWHAPVVAGDVVQFRTTLLSKRELESRPGWGLLEKRNEGLRAGMCVVSFGSRMLVQRR